MNSPAPIFELKNVTQKFSSFPSLTDINLQIYPGERVALVGSSGAGKSTLINLLNGTLTPTQGEVSIFGRNLTNLNSKLRRKVQRQIGTIYQQFHLVDNLRVIHNVNAGKLGHWSFFQAVMSLIYPLEIETALKALTKVGIPEKLYERTDRLSGGQQQRVAIARILVQNPVVILADEPISSLDPQRSREIMDLLCQLSEDAGKTLISSLHVVEYAFSHFQRIIGLREGRIFFDAPVEEVTGEMVEELYRIEPQDGEMGRWGDGERKKNPI
ncbi:MAG: phosphonate ABC transporter ATP-binding protein [Nostocaceae cyanobacterium]|nr:phosphonate ABC transporter ATP-binding protein [Nostocaceae cyanobacterium]